MKLLLVSQQIPDYQNFPIHSTNDATQYTFAKTHTMGISILPEYYQILCNLSNGDFDTFLKYLYFKFHNKLLSIKVAPIKKTATTTYQPPTQQYKNLKLKNISPYIWDKYWDLRRITGYSISYIIRLFLEWELEFKEKEQNTKTKQIQKEYQKSRNNLCQYKNFCFQNNYEVKKTGSSDRNEIIINFKERFY